MINLHITALYAGLLGLLYVVLFSKVVKLRFKHRVLLLDDGNPELTVAIRTHANFTENVPFALLVLAILELSGYSPSILYGLGGFLFLARILHAFGMDPKIPTKARKLGAVMTLIYLFATSLAAILVGFGISL